MRPQLQALPSRNSFPDSTHLSHRKTRNHRPSIIVPCPCPHLIDHVLHQRLRIPELRLRRTLCLGTSSLSSLRERSENGARVQWPFDTRDSGGFRGVLQEAPGVWRAGSERGDQWDQRGHLQLRVKSPQGGLWPVSEGSGEGRLLIDEICCLLLGVGFVSMKTYLRLRGQCYWVGF
jgi:hypothetical protein